MSGLGTRVLDLFCRTPCRVHPRDRESGSFGTRYTDEDGCRRDFFCDYSRRRSRRPGLLPITLRKESSTVYVPLSLIVVVRDDWTVCAAMVWHEVRRVFIEFVGDGPSSIVRFSCRDFTGPLSCLNHIPSEPLGHRTYFMLTLRVTPSSLSLAQPIRPLSCFLLYPSTYFFFFWNPFILFQGGLHHRLSSAPPRGRHPSRPQGRRR